MRLKGTAFELSASDLTNHLACAHLSALELRAARGELERPMATDPLLERLRVLGQRHEQAYVARLRAQGLSIVDLTGLPAEEAERRTLAALRAGEDAVVQAALREGRWRGVADVLLKVPVPSGLGAWSYEVHDTKLAQDTRAGTVLQLCLYADLLASVQGCPPEFVRVVKPGPDFVLEPFRCADYAAYFRRVRARLAAFVEGPAAEPYPEPVLHCEVCRWWRRCEDRRLDDDHLSLVAGMRRLHADELRRQGRSTLAAFAAAPEALAELPLRGHRPTFVALQAQAWIQAKGRADKRPVHELLSHEPGRGLARLPAPSAGDVFLDFEGDPFVPGPSGADAGLEFLLGCVCHDERGAPVYEARWAFDRAAEKEAFERFVDFVHARLARHPDLHVYHYAPYEPAALKRLASRHATRERELDVLLKGVRFVDLFAVVRQGVRASVESYSLKPLEAHFGYRREVDLREVAGPALQRVSGALEVSGPDWIQPEDRAAVEGYNRDDCLSLIALRAWLEERRDELVAGGAQVERPALKDGKSSEEVEQRSGELQQLFDRLVDGIPGELEARDVKQRARWLLAHMLEYFKREQRVSWWEYFARRLAVDDEELLGDRKAIVGLEFVERLPLQGRERTPVERYCFPPQEAAFDPGDVICDLGLPEFEDVIGEVRALDLARRTIDIKRAEKLIEHRPSKVHVLEDVPREPLAGSLLALGHWVEEHGLDAPAGEHLAARDLLLKRSPRLSGTHTGALAQETEESLAAAKRVALRLDGGVLAIQGPPGAGKTHDGARMLVDLARHGKRLGVTATSHKVIRNMLEQVLKAAAKEGVTLAVTHRPSNRGPRQTGLPPGYHLAKDKRTALDALDQGHVVGGVAWLWAAAEAEATLDYLFIDEAGQMSLAQVLACARSARNLILLGDPQQLQQPQRGAHPEGSDVSALSHLLQGKATIEPERGLFLAETWRLPPPLCDFTSDLFYDGRLRSRAGCDRQVLSGPTPFAGAGLFLVPVEHTGNQSSAFEEVEAAERVVDALLKPGVTWTDRHGDVHELTLRDLMMIAPYNAQVAALARRFALSGIEIGTVDRFQGQERPVVIYSLTSSTPADAPRGLSFLYDLHRLNVATSRACCACIALASPALFEPECRTPDQMRLASGLCSLVERATRVEL